MAYHLFSPSTKKEAPCVLIYIPDGATKARPTTGSKFKAVEVGDIKLEQQKKERPFQKVIKPQLFALPISICRPVVYKYLLLHGGSR